MTSNSNNQNGTVQNSKVLTRILFIDDKHKDYKMVSILKKSGWINTKSVKDITDLEDPKVFRSKHHLCRY